VVFVANYFITIYLHGVSEKKLHSLFVITQLDVIEFCRLLVGNLMQTYTLFSIMSPFMIFAVFSVYVAINICV